MNSLQYLIPYRGHLGSGTSEAGRFLEVTTGGRLRVRTGRAGDSRRAAVRATSHRIRPSGVIVPAAPVITGRQLYVEPTDYSTLPWEYNVQMTDAWVSANSTPGTGEWAGWRVVQGRSFSCPNSDLATSGTGYWAYKNAAAWMTFTVPVMFLDCNFRALSTRGTAGGGIGGPSGVTVHYEDSTFIGAGAIGVGMDAFLPDGWRNGTVMCEGFKRQTARHCNFVAIGFHPKNWKGSASNPLHRTWMEFCAFFDINGRTRDRSTASGWKEGNTLDVDLIRDNACQFITVSGCPGMFLRWCRVANTPGKSQIEDTFNNYEVYGLPDDWMTWEHLLVDGAYPMFPGMSYAGGGLMLGDGRGQYQQAINNVILNANNYSVAISGGNDMLHADFVALSRARRESDGARWDPDPDDGMYIRDYYKTAVTTGLRPESRRIMRGVLGHMGGTSGGVYYRKDGVSKVSVGQGVGTDNVSFVPAGGTSSSDIPVSAIDAARADYFADAVAAGVLIGRRRPVAA